MGTPPQGGSAPRAGEFFPKFPMDEGCTGWSPGSLSPGGAGRGGGGVQGVKACTRRAAGERN